MTSSWSDLQRVLSRVVWIGALTLVYMAIGAWCTNSFMEKWGFREREYRYGFTQMLDHTSHRPFAYRVLIPFVVNGLYDLLGPSARDRFPDLEKIRPAVRSRFFRAEGQLDWTPELSLKYHITYGILYLSLLGAMFALRPLTAAFFPGQPALRDVGPLLFVTLLPLSFISGGYFYDFPELLFLAGGFAAAASRRYRLLLVLVSLATLNKETAVLVPILLWPILAANEGRWSAGKQVALLTVLGVGISLVVKWWLAGNPGSTVEFQLWENLRYWGKITSYFKFTDFYAPLLPFPKGMNLMLVFVVGGTLFYGWKTKSPTLKHMLILALTINLPLLLAFSSMDELRNLSLSFVPMYIVACDTLRSWYSFGIGRVERKAGVSPPCNHGVRIS